MQKSIKRIKLENEIFSKSIRDIEKMFNSSITNDDERFHKKPSSNSSNSLEYSRSDIFSESVLKKTEFEYDCVNLHFIDSLSDQDKAEHDSSCISDQIATKAPPVPILPSSYLISEPSVGIGLRIGDISLDLTDDDAYDNVDRMSIPRARFSDFEGLYRRNLERDLTIIDQMFSKALHESIDEFSQ